MNQAIFKSALWTTLALGCVTNGCTGAPAGGDEGGQSGDTIAQTEEEITASICPPGVPASINPAANQTIKESLTGVGVQIYMCNATTAGGFAWTFVAPQANLFDYRGVLVGTHFIGPTWQGNGGSSVVGAKAAGATVDPTAVPWLLLNATSHGAVPGRFSDVTSIQRLDTEGGIAPVTACDATNVGAISQVPYTAQYVTYKTKATGGVYQCKG